MSALDKDALSKNACREIEIADDPDMEKIVSRWYVMGPDHTNKPPAIDKNALKEALSKYNLQPMIYTNHTNAPSAQDIEAEVEDCIRKLK